MNMVKNSSLENNLQRVFFSHFQWMHRMSVWCPFINRRTVSNIHWTSQPITSLLNLSSALIGEAAGIFSPGSSIKGRHLLHIETNWQANTTAKKNSMTQHRYAEGAASLHLPCSLPACVTVITRPPRHLHPLAQEQAHLYLTPSIPRHRERGHALRYAPTQTFGSAEPLIRALRHNCCNI